MSASEARGAAAATQGRGDAAQSTGSGEWHSQSGVGQTGTESSSSDQEGTAIAHAGKEEQEIGGHDAEKTDKVKQKVEDLEKDGYVLVGFEPHDPEVCQLQKSGGRCSKIAAFLTTRLSHCYVTSSEPSQLVKSQSVRPRHILLLPQRLCCEPSLSLQYRPRRHRNRVQRFRRGRHRRLEPLCFRWVV